MKNKLIKLISLILCMLMISPLFACNNGNNDESNNPPPETPKQTNFYDEILTEKNPKFYCYERFDNIEDATAYAKTWQKDYELFIPNIKEADSLRIDFTTYASHVEKEAFFHKIEFEYNNAEPYFKIFGNTTVYKNEELDKTEFYIEIKDRGVVPNINENYQYFYQENGKVGETHDSLSCQGYQVGLKQENFVLLDLNLFINKTEAKSIEEIKALTLDNIVPVEEQKYKDKEIPTDFDLGIEVLITGPQYIGEEHDSFGEFRAMMKKSTKTFDRFTFIVDCESFDEVVYKTRGEFSSWYYRLSSYYGKTTFEYLQTNGKRVEILLNTTAIPIILLDELDKKTFEYKLEIDHETDDGCIFIIKNGFANILSGRITAEDKTDINLEEIEQKILSNIVLIKGE